MPRLPMSQHTGTARHGRPSKRNVWDKKTDGQIAATASASHLVLSTVLASISRLGGDGNAEQPFLESGIDSLGAVQLRNELMTAFGIDLPPTVTFDYPTPAALANWIAKSLPNSSSSDVGGKEQYTQASWDTAPPPPPPADSIVREVASIVENILGTSVVTGEPLMSSGLDSLGAACSWLV